MKTERALSEQQGDVVKLQWVHLSKYVADSGDTEGASKIACALENALKQDDVDDLLASLGF